MYCTSRSPLGITCLDETCAKRRSITVIDATPPACVRVCTSRWTEMFAVFYLGQNAFHRVTSSIQTGLFSICICFYHLFVCTQNPYQVQTSTRLRKMKSLLMNVFNQLQSKSFALESSSNIFQPSTSGPIVWIVHFGDLEHRPWEVGCRPRIYFWSNERWNPVHKITRCLVYFSSDINSSIKRPTVQPARQPYLGC